MTTTITIHEKTKARFLKYGRMGETYDDVVNRAFDELEGLIQVSYDEIKYAIFWEALGGKVAQPHDDYCLDKKTLHPK